MLLTANNAVEQNRVVERDEHGRILRAEANLKRIGDAAPWPYGSDRSANAMAFWLASPKMFWKLAGDSNFWNEFFSPPTTRDGMASRRPVIETAFRFSGYQGRDGGEIKIHTVNGQYQPPEVGVLKEAIKLLAITFAAMRRHEGFPADPERDGLLQVVIGLLALALNEARALLLLSTMNMGISARVHLRSLGEYATRANVYLADQALGAHVYRSVAASLKELVEDSAPDQEVAVALDAALQASGEEKSDRKLVARGTRGYVEKAKGGLTMTYMQFRSWSGPSHASVAAMREVALRTKGHESEIVLALATDGEERQWLWTGAAFIQSLVLSSLQVLGATAPEVEKQYDLVAAELERLQRMADAAVPAAPPKPKPSSKV